MNESNFPIIAVSTTADTFHESDIPPNVVANPAPVANTIPAVQQTTGPEPDRTVLVLKRKARTIQSNQQSPLDETDAASESAPVMSVQEQWVFPSMLPQGGACLFVADHVSTMRMAATLVSVCCAEKQSLGGLHVKHDVSVFHVATSRMNAIDLMILDSWSDPGAGTYSKNYATGRYANMPISTPGFASRIRDDFNAAFRGLGKSDDFSGAGRGIGGQLLMVFHGRFWTWLARENGGFSLPRR